SEPIRWSCSEKGTSKMSAHSTSYWRDPRRCAGSGDSRCQNKLPCRTRSVAPQRRVKSLRGNEGWHHDSTYMPIQAKATVFTAEIVPSTGAATDGRTCEPLTRLSTTTHAPDSPHCAHSTRSSTARPALATCRRR